MKADVSGRVGEVGKCAQGLKSLEGESSSLLMSKYTKIIIIHIFPKRKGVPSSGPRERRNDQVISFPPLEPLAEAKRVSSIVKICHCEFFYIDSVASEHQSLSTAQLFKTNFESGTVICNTFLTVRAQTERSILSHYEKLCFKGSLHSSMSPLQLSL